MVKVIKKRYGFKKVTRSTLKHILYEGARLNRILRINNECFDKMVDILDIKCESDSKEDEKKMENTDKIINLNNITQNHEMNQKK